MKTIDDYIKERSKRDPEFAVAMAVDEERRRIRLDIAEIKACTLTQWRGHKHFLDIYCRALDDVLAIVEDNK